MKVFGIFILVIVLISLSETKVVRITSKNIKEVIHNPNADVLVKYYATWCGHCQRLKEPYEKASDAFDDDDDVIFAEVECDGEGKDVCQKASIRGYPTVRFFSKTNKNEPEDYNRERTVESLVGYMNDKCSKFRNPDGSLKAESGRDKEMDNLAQKFIKAKTEEEKQAVIKETQEKVDSLNNFDLYPKIMEKILKNSKYVETESQRLQNLINSGSITPTKKTEFSKKLNVIRAFN
eukprot:Anaeramoba_ignava/a3836_150.p1 GENE.a3836_150~~a3836_150.p1  ORF type:complete len:235 (-),score=77.84 a3836_150:66-770(-)